PGGRGRRAGTRGAAGRGAVPRTGLAEWIRPDGVPRERRAVGGFRDRMPLVRSAIREIVEPDAGQAERPPRTSRSGSARPEPPPRIRSPSIGPRRNAIPELRGRRAPVWRRLDGFTEAGPSVPTSGRPLRRPVSARAPPRFRNTGTAFLHGGSLL